MSRHDRTAPSPASREQALIADVFAPLADRKFALGLKDDAAFLRPRGGHDWVMTADMLVAGVHFLESDPADLIARKALRVNLSDLAAKAARPRHYLLCLAIPADLTRAWLQRFAKGLTIDQSEFDITLLGGDTVGTEGPLTISITAMGEVAAGKMVRRAGARPGDLIYVTGDIGRAALGLPVARGDTTAVAAMSRADQRALIRAYRLPQPRLGLARALMDHATAAMDISDGLAGDLASLCAASGVSARVALADLPFSGAVRRALKRDPACLNQAITGGDDYEILCTLRKEDATKFEHQAARAELPVTRIGVVTQGRAAPSFIGPDDRPLAIGQAGYSHF